MMPVFHGFGLCSSIHLPLSVGVSPNLIPEPKKIHLGKVLKEENTIQSVITALKDALTDKTYGASITLPTVAYVTGAWSISPRYLPVSHSYTGIVAAAFFVGLYLYNAP